MEKRWNHKEIIYIKTCKARHEERNIENDGADSIRDSGEDDRTNDVNYPEKYMQINKFFNFHKANLKFHLKLPLPILQTHRFFG